MTILMWLISVAITVPLNGLALAVLWRWFMVPPFGLPALTAAQAIGVSLVVSYLTHQTDLDKKDSRSAAEQIASSFIFGLLKPGFALLAGAIIREFL